MKVEEPRFVLRGAYVGSFIAFLTYLLIGFLPGMLYGGYMGLAMAGAIFGIPVEATILSKIMVGGGLLLGVVSSLFFFLVIGANLGTIGSLIILHVIRWLNTEKGSELTMVSHNPPGPIVAALKDSLENSKDISKRQVG